MVIDTSALVAVLFGEPERDAFVAVIADADDPSISAATLVETSIVMRARIGDDGVADLDALPAVAAARCIAVDRGQALLARHAFARFKRGWTPAALNLGDCFSTDIVAARP